MSNAQLNSVTTVELAQELCARFQQQQGVNDVPRELIGSIINALEAEFVNRLAQVWHHESVYG